MKTLNFIRYNIYALFSVKKTSILFLILLLAIFHKTFQYDNLNKFISVFGAPVILLFSDILSTILFYFAPLIIIKDNFIKNYEKKRNLILPRINNINLWMAGMLLSYLLVIFIYFFIAYIIVFSINQSSSNLLDSKQLFYELITKYGINRITLNLVFLNILISFIYVLNFIFMYTLSRNAGISTIINLCIMLLSYMVSIKSPNIAINFPTSQGIARVCMLNKYSFSNSYIIIFITIVVLLIIIFSLKKCYLQ